MTNYVLNTWYPIAWARDIGRSLAKRRVLEKDLVLYRTEAGQIAVLEDACPHKLAPLSIGTLKGDSIECGYHGLTFDCTGRCTHSPGQDRIPARLQARAYPSAERLGLVWAWMGDPAKADIGLLFDLPQYHDPDYSLVEGDALLLHANYLNLADNLCDPSHVSYVHKTTLANANHAGAEVHHKQEDGKVVTWRWVLDSPLIPIFKPFKQYAGHADRWHYYHYYAPCIAVIDFGAAPVGTGAQEGRREDAIQMYACHFITPVDERTCVQHWLCLKNVPADAEKDEQLKAGLRIAFDEDKQILEAIQKNEDQPRDWQPIKLAIDASSVKMRRMVEDMAAL